MNRLPLSMLALLTMQACILPGVEEERVRTFRTAPPTCVRPQAEGLRIDSADPKGGLFGAYRRDDRVVYFQAMRGEVNAEYFWIFAKLGDTTPKYSVPNQLLDRNCTTFSSTGVRESGNQPPFDWKARHADMRLASEAMIALAAAKLPVTVRPEVDALTGAYTADSRRSGSALSCGDAASRSGWWSDAAPATAGFLCDEGASKSSLGTNSLPAPREKRSGRAPAAQP